jgi:phosphatidylglycerophosphate synthase
VLTIADRITLARVGIAPIAAACYLLVPVDHNLCFWVAGLLCGACELTDWMDGKVARARGEVSEFGKLADPFCDVFYRMLLFMVFILPAGGVGWPADAGSDPQQRVFLVGQAGGQPLLGAGTVPWLPVVLMVLREVVQAAVRSMCALRGLALAARTSGKVKAWVQGLALGAVAMAFPAFGGRQAWMLDVIAWATWLAAAVSLLSLAEYLWVNRGVLRGLVERS